VSVKVQDAKIKDSQWIANFGGYILLPFGVVVWWCGGEASRIQYSRPWIDICLEILEGAFCHAMGRGGVVVRPVECSTDCEKIFMLRSFV
jgi:hypothetical protein